MKHLSFLLVTVCIYTLFGCMMPGKVQPSPVVQRDWSTFEVPPVGTPVLMRAFFVTGPRDWDSFDFPGTWGDGDPFLVSFPIYCTVDNVVRIEIHFHGEVIAARNFKPPTQLTGGTTAGWTK